MGSIKAKPVKIELATVTDLGKSLKLATDAQQAGVKQARDLSGVFKTVQSKFADVVAEADTLIAKAKDIGADQIVKDALTTKALATAGYKDADTAITRLNF